MQFIPVWLQPLPSHLSFVHTNQNNHGSLRVLLANQKTWLKFLMAAPEKKEDKQCASFRGGRKPS